MTDVEVEELAKQLVAYWQKQLRLEDWDITVRVPAHHSGNCAEISHAIEHSKADIVIRNPARHPPTSAADPDLETTVVHEMLHLRFHHITYKDDDTESRLWEQGIEVVAKTLVMLNRNQRRGE